MSSRPSRQDLVLAALSPAACAPFQPVQVQKLFFLIDKQLAGALGGTYFDFEPYDYGPFDKSVYLELEQLEAQGLITITQGRYRKYTLTEAGRARGEVVIAGMSQPVADGLRTLCTFVRSLGFADLVTSIYRAYPEMRANSVFSG